MTTHEGNGHAAIRGHDTGVAIRLLGPARGSVSVLELEVERDWRRLDRLKQALLELGIRVLSSQSQSFGDRLVHWLRVVQSDGGAIPEWRRAELTTTLTAAMGRRQRRSGVELVEENAKRRPL